MTIDQRKQLLEEFGDITEQYIELLHKGEAARLEALHSIDADTITKWRDLVDAAEAVNRRRAEIRAQL